MNKILPTIIILLLILSCSKKREKEFIKIKLVNSTSKNDTLIIYDYFDYKTIKKIPINNETEIIDTLNSKRGYFGLKSIENNTTIFLKNNYNLNIEIGEKGLKFSGIGGNENNYLIERQNFIYSSSIPSTAPTSDNHIKLSEKGYLKLLNSNYNKKMSFLSSYKDLEDSFVKTEQESFYYDKMVSLGFYESNMKYLKDDKSFKVSSKFPKLLYENLNLTNEDLLIHYNYILYVDSYLQKINTKKSKENPLSDKIVIALETIDEEITNPKIKDVLVYYNTKWSLLESKKIDLAYQKTNSLLKNNNYKKEITDIYLRSKKLSKGDISPNFTFKSNENKFISLTDLKGSIVYIDIWNTYCKPCIKEIPEFEKLKNNFNGKKIEFVSICINSEEKNWLDAINKYNLTGIQLYSKKSDGTFFNKYIVNSEPRYILIDKKGNIIESYSKKPSNPKLKEQIEKLLL